MDWNKHPEIEGRHAFLSPSKSTWLRKSDDEIAENYISSYAQQIGTLVHAYAADRIKYRYEIADADARTLKFELVRQSIPEIAIDMDYIFPTVQRYINDSIACGMDPEVPLKYSDRCFGTADAIQFRRKKLRIHDLKTGVSPAKIDQLMIYAALFFHEYSYKPESIHTELRIYQAGDILLCEPTAKEIREVMEIIIHEDQVIESLLAE